MTQDQTSAAYYDGLKRGVELPDDPKPCSKTALKARKRAIQDGRLRAPSRDEVEAAKAAEAAAVEEAKAAEEAAEKTKAAEEEAAMVKAAAEEELKTREAALERLQAEADPTEIEDTEEIEEAKGAVDEMAATLAELEG